MYVYIYLGLITNVGIRILKLHKTFTKSQTWNAEDDYCCFIFAWRQNNVCHKATVTKASRGCFFLCALTWLWTHLMTYWYGSMAGVFSGRGLIILLMCHYSMCLHGSFRRQRAAVLDESASGVCQTSLRQQRQGNTLTLSAVNRTQVQASGVCLCFCCVHSLMWYYPVSAQLQFTPSE